MSIQSILRILGNTNRLGYPIALLSLLCVFSGLTVASTSILQYLLSYSIEQSQLIAGILMGTGTVGLIGGVFISVPDKPNLEINIGLFGISVCAVSIAIFVIQFPQNWSINELSTIATVGFLFAAGFLIISAVTFHAMVNFRIKSGEDLTVTHMYAESQDTHSEPTETNASPDLESTEPVVGGVGTIGDIRNDPEARETYGSRTPMSKEDRERYTVGNRQNKK